MRYIESSAQATTGQEAITLASSLQTDLIIMDIQMPVINGIQATREILRASPHIHVLIVTMFDDDASVFAAIRADARGYILKGANQAETLRAIRAVGSGEALFSPAIAVRLMDFFAQTRPSRPAQLFPELSDREREILGLIAQGYKNSEIAALEVLSPKTVRNHVSNILSKLQVADRAEAILRARGAGLGYARQQRSIRILSQRSLRASS